MTIQNVLSSKISIPGKHIASSPSGNLMYTIQSLFIRVTSQLSTQNQESQKRLSLTKKEYRLSTSKAALFQKEQGVTAKNYAFLALAPALVAPFANHYLGNEMGKGICEGTSSILSGYSQYKTGGQRASETTASGEAQIHQSALSDSQPKGDESSLKNVIEQLLSYLRDAFKSASR